MDSDLDTFLSCVFLVFVLLAGYCPFWLGRMKRAAYHSGFVYGFRDASVKYEAFLRAHSDLSCGEAASFFKALLEALDKHEGAN